MYEVTPTVVLTAAWTHKQDEHIDRPQFLFWEDGSQACQSDFDAHRGDTHECLRDRGGCLVLKMYPEIIADVRYDTSRGAWTVSGAGVVPATLSIADPSVPDWRLVDQLMCLPIVYRARVHRESDPVSSSRFATL